MKITVMAIAAAGFFRAGRHWPHKGVTVDQRDFTDDEWERIARDPNLKILPGDGTTAPEEAAAVRAKAVEVAIRSLPTEAYGSDATPNLKPLNAAMGKGEDKVDAKERDAVFASMLEAGFTLPIKTTPDP